MKIYRDELWMLIGDIQRTKTKCRYHKTNLSWTFASVEDIKVYWKDREEDCKVSWRERISCVCVCGNSMWLLKEWQVYKVDIHRIFWSIQNAELYRFWNCLDRKTLGKIEQKTIPYNWPFYKVYISLRWRRKKGDTWKDHTI